MECKRCKDDYDKLVDDDPEPEGNGLCSDCWARYAMEQDSKCASEAWRLFAKRNRRADRFAAIFFPTMIAVLGVLGIVGLVGLILGWE